MYARALITLGLLLVCIATSAPFAHAQGQLALTVTPPLFQLSAEPGEFWQSSVKVVNSNPYELTLFAEVVNFEAQGEQGHGRFIPLINEELDQTTLAGWIDITKDPIVIPPEQSKEIPFYVTVPDDASPGGHFAAILIGTQPPKTSNTPLAVQTSQVVTSLFFVRVGGEVIESGDIRQFSVEHSLEDTPRADFILRFENKGNVHLQPQGDITIFNMWGKERGYIPINHKTNFGNVLPKSIRQFELSWEGEVSLADIGRYTAVVTLGFGTEQKNFVSREVSFYVIPVKAALVTLSVLAFFGFFIAWAIRRYIRKAMYLAGYTEDEMRGGGAKSRADKAVKLDTHHHARDLSAPIRSGVIDLRARLEKTHSTSDRMRSLWAFVRSYKLFFGSAVVGVIGIIVLWMFLADVLSSNKSYEVVVVKPDGDITISSEEVIKDRLDGESGASVSNQSLDSVNQPFTLSVVNASDLSGAAAEVAVQLEGLGYRVDNVTSDTERKQQRTVIVYDTSVSDVAIRMSEQLGGVLISARAVGATTTPEILVVVGKD